MASMLKIELENAENRLETLLKTQRNDVIALIVLNRMHEEIETLKRKLKHEEEPRQEVIARTSTSGFARCFREALHRYGVKCYGNNNAVSSIPTSATLQETRATT